MSEMTLQEAREVAGKFFVGLERGVAVLVAGGIKTEHDSIRRAFECLGESVDETIRLSDCQLTPWWFKLLIRSGYSPIEAVRAYRYIERASLCAGIPESDFVDFFCSIAAR